jgi:hypothetical protein
MTDLVQFLPRWPRSAGTARRLVKGLLIAAGAAALCACESMPDRAPPTVQSGEPLPTLDGAEALPAAGPPGSVVAPVQPDPPATPPTPAAPATPATPAPPAVAPERTIALLGTRQLRCADPGPQAQDPQRAHGHAFRDAAQWRAYLAGIDEGMRAALASFEIGFNAGESAVLVRPGALPNLGYRILIPQQRLPVSAGTLGVNLQVEPPPPHLLQAQVIAFPCIYLRLAGADYDQVAVEVERLAAP